MIMTRGEYRTLVIAVLTLAILAFVVPFHYWAAVALLLKVTASISLAALTIGAYLRRRP